MTSIAFITPLPPLCLSGCPAGHRDGGHEKTSIHLPLQEMVVILILEVRLRTDQGHYNNGAQHPSIHQETVSSSKKDQHPSSIVRGQSPVEYLLVGATKDIQTTIHVTI